MFSELIRRNSKRNRQENTLYFVTMILTVAAFYIILELKGTSDGNLRAPHIFVG